MLNIVPTAAEVGRHITLLTVWVSRLRLVAGIDAFSRRARSTADADPVAIRLAAFRPPMRISIRFAKTIALFAASGSEVAWPVEQFAGESHQTSSCRFVAFAHLRAAGQSACVPAAIHEGATGGSTSIVDSSHHWNT